IGDVVANFAIGEPDAEARIVTARCGGCLIVSVYVPNGRALDNDHYQYKLRWMKQLKDHLGAIAKTVDDVVVAGDFNIAPADIDVWDPQALLGSTHVSEPERQVLADLCSWGLIDVFRQQHPDEQLYSWWDYRNGSFHKGHGMRIDLMLTSESVAERTSWSVVDRNARKGETPSDHAPVIIRIEDE
ncbi:MAG: exodeoxyribonuclease III, partial [Actinomycetota bacterium]